MEQNKPKNPDRFPKGSSEIGHQTSRGDTKKVLHENKVLRGPDKKIEVNHYESREISLCPTGEDGLNNPGNSRQQKRKPQHDEITENPSLKFFDRVPRRKYTKKIDYDKGPCVTSFGDILISMGICSLGSWLGGDYTKQERSSKRIRLTEDSEDDEKEEKIHSINLKDVNEGDEMHKIKKFMVTNRNLEKAQNKKNPQERKTRQSESSKDVILYPEREAKYEFCSLNFYAADILDPEAWDLHTINPDKYAKDE